MLSPLTGERGSNRTPYTIFDVFELFKKVKNWHTNNFVSKKATYLPELF